MPSGRAARWERTALAVFCLALFALLLDSILVESGLTKAFDRTGVLDVHRYVPAGFKGLMSALSVVGNTGEALGIGALMSLLLLWLLRHHVAALPVLAPGIASGVDEVMKITIRRPRPHLWPGASLPSSFSFPSGHATVSGALAAAITWVAIWHLAGLARVALIATSVLFALGVGFSRLFLGVHWPTDVLGGYALGTCIVGLVAWLLTIVRVHRPDLPAGLVDAE